MDKHLILIDLDGTLLKSDRSIGEINKKYIARAIEDGHEVVLVTGRAHYRSHMFYEELGLNSILVNRNSAHIHRPHDTSYPEQMIYISQDAVKAILKEITASCEELYIEKKNTIYFLKGETSFYDRYPLCEKVIKQSGAFVEKVNLVSAHVRAEHFNDVQKQLDMYSDIMYEIYKHENETMLFNIYPKQADKSKSIQILSAYYGVPNERIIAFGDGSNDIEFIQTAGIGVAMRNAIPEVKQAAKIVNKYTNDESGVGLFIRDYFNYE